MVTGGGGAEGSNPLTEILRLVLEPGVSKVFKKVLELRSSLAMVAEKRYPLMEGSVFSRTMEKAVEPMRGKAPPPPSLEESDRERGMETEEVAHKQ